MAELTWRNIDAPNIDVRNLAIAGNSIGTAFDRMGQMLADRTTRLKQEATNQALAGVLMAQDPDAARAAYVQAQVSGNPRIDLATLAKGYNEQYGVLQDRAIKDDQVDGLKAEKIFGAMLPELTKAYYGGNQEQIDALLGTMSDDPAFGRYVRGHMDQLMTQLHTGTGDRQNQAQIDEAGRHNKASEVNAAGELALSQRRFQLEEKDRANAEAGAAMGLQFAKDYRLLDPASAQAKLYDDPRFQQLNALQQKAVLSTFGTAHGELSKPLSSDLQSMEGTTSQLAAVDSALTAGANAAEARATNPDAAGVRKAATYSDLTMDKLVSNLSSRMGPLQNAGTARDGIQRLLTDVKGATLGDIQAAIDANGYDPGAGKYVPFLDIYANKGQGDALKTQVQRIVDARKQGYTANEKVDIANARLPYETLQKKLADTRDQVLRYQRANEPVPELLYQRLNDQLTAARMKAGQ